MAFTQFLDPSLSLSNSSSLFYELKYVNKTQKPETKPISLL